MDDVLSTIAKAACTLATRLPIETMLLLARLVRESKDCHDAKARIAEVLCQPYYRDLALSFVDSWKQCVEPFDPAAVALCLVTASHSECGHRQNQSVELVWTGPDSGAVPFRRTEQALLQVLDSAEDRITLVSYAVYRIPNVAAALVRAAQRGVRIKVIVETPDPSEGEQEYDTIQALGDEVAAACRIYYWPAKQREPHSGGKRGILHVKCLVADEKWLFLSSANLTEYAFTVNMELGTLVLSQAYSDWLFAVGW
jgi:phosphatidylserine/phosphatidylglycerophosphate/cardiolipin synthase-like enzyme